MDYQKIYNNLIKRASCRETIDADYYEKHHIVPRCLGGTDENNNIVKLTAREHFIAHLCLVKIYPLHHGLIKAAMMMSCEAPTHQRSGNRIYEWMRKKHSSTMSWSQTGVKNSQFGSVWIFNESLRTNKKIKILELENYTTNGWKKGRVLNFDAIYQVCEVCKTKFINSKVKRKTCSNECHHTHVGKFKSFIGREEEFKKYYKQTNSMNKSLQLMGFKGAVSHYYIWAKSIINS